MKYTFLLFASILFLSCSDEQLLNPILFSPGGTTSGVKSKTYYSTFDSNQVLRTEDFEYNNDGQLQKKNYYGGNREMLYQYELFIYNNNKLIYKLNYYKNINSPTGFILIDSTIYSYAGNFLISEINTFPYGNNFESINYEYGGRYVIKKTKYHNDELDSYTTYHYKDGKLYREINYYKDNSVTESLEYKYKDVLLIEKIYYTFRNEAKRRISYSYNRDRKLILEKVDELLIFSSSLPYVVKYEY